MRDSINGDFDRTAVSADMAYVEEDAFELRGRLSGQQLAATVLAERPSLPVLLVSGHADEIAAPDAPLNPRIGFLRKPFRKSELAHRLADMLPAEIVEPASE